jgi:hypothetical protein
LLSETLSTPFRWWKGPDCKWWERR